VRLGGTRSPIGDLRCSPVGDRLIFSCTEGDVLRIAGRGEGFVVSAEERPPGPVGGYPCRGKRGNPNLLPTEKGPHSTGSEGGKKKKYQLPTGRPVVPNRGETRRGGNRKKAGLTLIREPDYLKKRAGTAGEKGDNPGLWEGAGLAVRKSTLSARASVKTLRESLRKLLYRPGRSPPPTLRKKRLREEQ